MSSPTGGRPGCSAEAEADRCVPQSDRSTRPVPGAHVDSALEVGEAGRCFETRRYSRRPTREPCARGARSWDCLAPLNRASWSWCRHPGDSTSDSNRSTADQRSASSSSFSSPVNKTPRRARMSAVCSRARACSSPRCGFRASSISPDSVVFRSITPPRNACCVFAGWKLGGSARPVAPGARFRPPEPPPECVRSRAEASALPSSSRWRIQRSRCRPRPHPGAELGCG